MEAAVLAPAREAHAHADRRLRAEPVAWLTTVRADGQAQSTPVWFLWDGDTFLVFSQPGAQKVRNLTANPKVSLHLSDDGAGGDVVSFEGTAAVEPDTPRPDRVEADLAKSQAPSSPPATPHPPRPARAGASLAKYRAPIADLGYEPGPFARTYSTAIRIRPTRVR